MNEDKLPIKSVLERIQKLGEEHYRVDKNVKLTSFNFVEKLNKKKCYSVIKVEDKETGEEYVLKKLKCSKEKPKEMKMSSVREMSLYNTLKHPNIIMSEFFSIGRNIGDNFVVFEYCQEDLSKLLKSCNSFNQSEIKCMMQMLLRGVMYLHNQLIIHRNLCSPNILIHPSGMIKIGGLSSARSLEKTRIDEMQSDIGTPGYRAPELCFGFKNYTTSIDMWSVGCIFGEMLLRKPLFSCDKTDENQLNSAIKLCGYPPTEFLSPFASHSFLRNNRLINQKDEFGTTFQAFPKFAVSFLKEFLKYGFNERINAEDALSNKYFATKPDPLDPILLKGHIDKKRIESTMSRANTDIQHISAANIGVTSPLNTTLSSLREMYLSDGEVVDV